MKKVFILSAALLLFVSLSNAQQRPSATPPEDEVVRISTDLIQIDVTVTDKNGKVVSGLNADDFEVFENGEKQTLSAASFRARSVGGASVGSGGVTQAGAPAAPLTAGAVRRTIAIVVDDLTMSYAGVYYARRALKRFVEEQMQPGDLVAIIRSAGSVGALQQFTSDKQLLLAAIDSIKWNPLTSEIEALSPIGQSQGDLAERFRSESDGVAAKLGGDTSGRRGDAFKMHESVTQVKARDYNELKNANQVEAGLYAQASLGTMRYLIRGMDQLPGRKLMFLLTDGLQITNETVKSRSSYVYEMLQDLVEFANRSSVVVYAFDTKGLKSMSIQASDSTYEIIDGHRGQKERLRTDDFKASQEGLAYLAKQTGGQALLNSNDLNGAIQRSLDEQAGYYLLAYVPAAETFDPAKRKFNKLEVKVRQPGLNVSYRSGFFNSAPVEPKTVALSNQGDLAKALTSPFASNQIALSANSLFADEDAGTYVRSFLHIDAKNLSFSDTADGWKTATFDIGAVAFGNDGVAVEQKDSQYTIKAKGPTFDTMLQKGFVYVLIVPVKKPGVYQYRVAVRDTTSGKIGSASQVLEVPDLSKRKLTISSMAVENVSMSIWQNIAAGKVGSGPGQIQVPSTLLYDTVLREFKAGTVLRYGFEVYNAKGDANDMPKLETQAKILQNNATVIEGSLNKVNAAAQNDPRHVKVSGAIMLKDTLQPGDYLLQLTVFDRSGKQAAIQIMPFAIVK
jgi:VWFA-related protein